jgi:hypothetical protein
MTSRIVAPRASVLLFSVVVVPALAGAVSAQTTFSEIEPNCLKSEATPAVGMVSGDSLAGTSTGPINSPGVSLVTTVDTFRVKTAAAPLGIYRHALAITTTGSGGYTVSILGLTQSNGIINTTSDVAFSTSSPATTPQPFNVWYGFGKQEEIYYRVSGTPSTTAPYVSTLTTSSIAPIAVSGTFVAGTVSVSALGQGHNTDTEIYLYDGALNPVPLGHQDDPIGTVASPSNVTLTLAAGTYYVAISDWNMSNDQSDLNPAEQADDDPLLDFPNAIANNTTGLNVNVQFSVSDGTTTTVVPALRANPYDIVWATFTVGVPTSPSIPYCFGDGSGTACPCANAGAAGHGCASSINANGAHLASSGLASISADSFVLAGSGMPNSSALYFQGTARTSAGAGAAFGDGLRCASGSVIRLGTKVNSGGSSSFPVSGDPAIHVKGADSAGNVRDYQCWYRNAAAFCTPSTFNLTNGLEITWGP